MTMSVSLAEDTLAALFNAARDARAQAYAPYSRFSVGAALIDETGAVHSGCNVENAAYPEGTCAEAGAIAAMVRAGGRNIRFIAIVGTGERACPPCGGCRQKIREFAAPDCAILLIGESGHLLKTTSLAALLPESFGPDNLV
jgi:cytidine deaminase